MSGQELYACYEGAHADRSIGVETWDQLTDQDREIWNDIAYSVFGP